MNPHIPEVEEAIKDFESNHVEYSDGGVLVRFFGKNGVDLDDFLRSKLTTLISQAEKRGREKAVRYIEQNSHWHTANQATLWRDTLLSALTTEGE